MIPIQLIEIKYLFRAMPIRPNPNCYITGVGKEKSMEVFQSCIWNAGDYVKASAVTNSRVLMFWIQT